MRLKNSSRGGPRARGLWPRGDGMWNMVPLLFRLREGGGVVVRTWALSGGGGGLVVRTCAMSGGNGDETCVLSPSEGLLCVYSPVFSFLVPMGHHCRAHILSVAKASREGSVGAGAWPAVNMDITGRSVKVALAVVTV